MTASRPPAQALTEDEADAVFVRLANGTTWPNPADPTEVEWRLRYGNPTRSDILIAASTMAAYRALAEGPQRLRSELRTALRGTS